jgi:hypothetical protein
VVDGQDYHSHSDILVGWQRHFSKLATPTHKPHFDPDFYDQVSLETAYIKQLMTAPPSGEMTPVSEAQVHKAIYSLKDNKAPDAQGLMAEHLKLGGRPVITFLTSLFNKIIQAGFIPETMRAGTVIPILKKSKDQTLPGNYRGITITSTIAKVLESTLLNVIESSFRQCPLQRGFSRGVSPSYAALLVEEAINEAKDLAHPLAMATLDAEKAFDVVWHDGLIRKLFHLGIPTHLLQIISQLQTEATSCVQWNQDISEEFQVLQGIRQGAKLSPLLYKIFVDNAISLLHENQVGASIGCIHVGVPTVADDIAIVADSPVDLQTALHFLYENSKKDRSSFNSSKSEIVIFNSKKSRIPQTWMLGLHPIPESSSSTHLGIHRDVNGCYNIADRVQIGRRTVYSLLGAGLHGRRGVSPVVSCKMYVTFVRPKVIHGLETVQLNNKEIHLLEAFEIKLLRQIQSLPDRTASVAIYILLGIPPITSIIEKNAINLFMNILRDPDSVEHLVITRQLAMKDYESRSWTVYVRNLLRKYNLPSAYDLLLDPPHKAAWKRTLDEALNSYWYEKWTEQKTSKSSLRFLHIPTRPLQDAHPVWRHLKNPREVTEAIVKARVLTGTYTLQANRHKFNQFEVDPTCLLCSSAPEDRLHFLLHCPSLDSIRTRIILNINKLLLPEAQGNTSTIGVNDCNKIQAIIDSGHDSIQAILSDPDSDSRRLEQYSLILTYNLHNERSKKLATLA